MIRSITRSRRRAAGTLAVFVVVVASFVPSASARASVVPSGDSRASRSASASMPLVDADLEALFAGVNSSAHRFDGQEALSAGAQIDDVSAFAAGYAAGGGTTTHATIDSRLLAMFSTGILSCSGKNSQDFTGAQANLYLNSCVSNDVSGKLAQGAGAAAIAGLIASETGIGGFAGGIIAGLLTIASGAVASCNKAGRGIVVHQIPLTGITWCNGQ